MPMCARCLGASLGHMLAVCLGIFLAFPSWGICAILLLPMLWDWALQEFLDVPSTNSRRFATGLMGGFALGCVVWKTVIGCAFLLVT